jgi:hypothetical protein
MCVLCNCAQILQCARTTALIDQWISIEYSYFQAAWTPLFVDRILKPRSEPKHTPDEVTTLLSGCILAFAFFLFYEEIVCTPSVELWVLSQRNL